MSRRSRIFFAALTSLLLVGALSSATFAQEAGTGDQAAQSDETATQQGALAEDDAVKDHEWAGRAKAIAQQQQKQKQKPKPKPEPEPEAESLGVNDEARNCDDFATQEEAQEYFTANGGSDTTNVDNLDRDGDGVACETGEQASAPGSAVGGSPTSGPHAGGGGTAAAPGESPTGFILGGAVVGLLLGGIALMRRRRALA